MLRFVWMLAAVLLPWFTVAHAAQEYTVEDTFDGCDYGKLYALAGGGILECLEYQYFYDYRPRVIASGREVIIIGDNRVNAVLHNGSVHQTYISGEFNGCDFDKVYSMDNGLLFQCSTYSYTYSYRPEVKIFVVEGRTPSVHIGGEKYDGRLLRAR
jgi:hypothetical protein